MNGLRDWVRLLRPAQWLKNGFALAPLLFSGRAPSRTAELLAAAAFLAFCAVSSAIYAFNDVADREQDRLHPVKCRRPVASGRIAPSHAVALGVVLLAVALFVAWRVAPGLLAAVVAYAVLNVVYTVKLKHVVLLDVFAIATSFVLRLVGGAAAIGVRPSEWLVLCGGLLALYLGFAKRRHEILTLAESSGGHRKVLTEYSPAFLDQMSGVLLGVTIVCYIMYTLTSETARQVGAVNLAYSTVFVLYGVFRYMYLVHRRDLGTPMDTIFTDRPLMVAVAAWLAYCFWVIYRPF